MLLTKSNFFINFIELKYRTFYFLYSLFVTFIVCFFFKIELFFIISNFFLHYKQGFIYTNLLDPIVIYIKLTILFALLLSYPFFIYIYGFFFLKSFYNFYLYYYFFYFSFVYLIGFYLFFIISKFFLPFLFAFLISFQRVDEFELLELTLQATITQYYQFFFSYLYIYFILVLIPNIFLILTLLNVFSYKHFLQSKFRKYLYLIIGFFFLLVAPPDFFVQLLILPLVILFLEFFIYLISFLYILYSFFNFFEESRNRTCDE